VAYTLSNRFSIKNKQGILLWILSTKMAPPIMVAIPFYIIFRVLSIRDTYLGMVLIYMIFDLSFAVWMIRGFIEGIPKELEEAARVDGTTSTQSRFELRVEPFKFDADIGGTKTPVDFTGIHVPPPVPRRRFFPHLFYRRYPLRQPLLVYHTQLYLSHVKPAPVFRCVMRLQCSVISARLQPSRGATNMKILQVPFRTYSLSKQAGFPGGGPRFPSAVYTIPGFARV
jgi:hypothetical protein